MLVGSGPRTRLYPGVEPLLPFVFRTAETPAGLQISTVVKTFRDLEVPPVAAFLGRRRRHTIRVPAPRNDAEKTRRGNEKGCLQW